jgi:8-oxo-dGTP pyrophosphatase MutT (NUDIX family)
MRGKYRQKDASYLRRLVDEMTLDEKSKIISLSFDKLWTGLWGEHVGQQYRGEHKDSYVKFQRLSSGLWGYKLKDIVAASKTTYVDTEWGLPKGRRNYQERDLTAALREFEEETGYPSQKLSLIANVCPLEECFTGSNLKSYKHLYFLAFQLSEASPQPFQASEVSDVRWFLLDEALAIIRPYNLEKKEVIQRADNILANYKVYH